MSYKYDISICLPAYRTQFWQKLYDTAGEACGPYNWELIMAGPNDPPPELDKKRNFKFFKDYGSPARCAQIATVLAEGELMMHASDDGYFLKDSIKECIEMHDDLSFKDFVIARLTEGENHSGAWFDDSYWKAWTHPDLRLPGVPQDYYIALLSVHKLDYYRQIGGLDCRFEHINMNLHDLSFRAQRDGARMLYSPNQVINCDWSYLWSDHAPVQSAYEQNDKALFEQLYSVPRPERIKIDYFNWTKSDTVWKRRFGDLK
jgi:hypothetical protein